ncbi:MAG: hypothetical protein NVSMB26_09050 [Beijerinckiaceae bacterium]
MIHRADALDEVLRATASRLGALTILAVHARPDRPAIRILLRGLKDRRSPLSLAPPLVLHTDDGTFTAAAQALHRGEARIDWGEVPPPSTG